MKSSGPRSEVSDHSGSSFESLATVAMDRVDEHPTTYDSALEPSVAMGVDEAGDWEVGGTMTEAAEAAVVSAERSSGVRPLAQSLVDEVDDVAKPEPAFGEDDREYGAKDFPRTTEVTIQPTGIRPPLNGDTPAATKVLGRCVELMRTKSNWMRQFSSKMVRQAVWADLGRALASPIDSTSTLAVARETEGLLRAMGCESQMYPSTMALADWSPTEAATALSKWKRKLRSAFGTTGAGVATLVFGSTTYLVQTEADPSRVPLPLTPQKGTTDVKGGTFAAKGPASPYMQDSHMVTPRSVNRSDRLAKENEASFTTPNTRRTTVRPPKKRFEALEESSDSDEDRFDPDYYDWDQTGEWARQVRELSAANGRSNTPRLEIATHLPLGNIKPFLGTRNKSELSMQWLRTFMYEMKGTHTPTNEWCMAFELSSQDGALHWYRQLPRKTKRTWKLLSDAFIKYYCSKFTQSVKARYYSAKREDKEHVCDYLNRLNGYARNAGVQFENGAREVKDHVDHFLDTCDDRGLEERLCHARVKDIHDLDKKINDILRSRERKTAREPSVRRHRGQDDDRRRENRSNEGMRSGFGRERRHRDDGRRRERRDESPYRSMIILVEALADVVAALNTRASDGDREDSQSARGYGRDETEAGVQHGTSYDADEYSDAESDASEVSADAHGHVDATNDNERRAAAAGTFARPDNRRQSGGSNQFQRDREVRRQYGPCATCNSPYHLVHYCNRRCKLCKQVHDAGKCDALRELTSLLRTKVDKKDLTPELQSLVFWSHLN
ncbi:hypothetical protein PF005_g19742 [Phytophthora fragariae]|uniref:Retrotransposon gag domain-containing protein n=1 Tax=Phytophthora fragariae TaxID=53985 RepID=A0A6A3QHT6_9STRA|nr:hypothetical protein PF003_g41039 [Phytophthora fragariae]KAE8926379.1 hypothetical protein PF009_g23432 [Phytophthora fragariae]KAE9076017.1 hypothetical protein PF006_g28214 [Phytophthora fragariae]KAE9189191.1 hypothetical protein PF005_g19742 [Phytophthora fragariae]